MTTLHPHKVYTPSQAAEFIGCRPRDVKHKISVSWWDGNKPKFLGKVILDYQNRRIKETQAIRNLKDDIFLRG